MVDIQPGEAITDWDETSQGHEKLVSLILLLKGLEGKHRRLKFQGGSIQDIYCINGLTIRRGCENSHQEFKMALKSFFLDGFW